MAKTASRVNIITSPGFIKGLRITIVILSCVSALSLVTPVRSMSIRNHQMKHLDILDDSITEVTEILMKFLLESFTIQKLERLDEVVDRFMLDFNLTQNTLSRLDQGVNLQLMEENLNPRLIEISNRIRSLNDNGVLTDSMPLIERNYTIRNRGFQNIDDMEKYVMLTDTVVEIQFFLMHIVDRYRYELVSTTSIIEDLKQASGRMINSLVFLLLLDLILVGLLMSAKSLQRSMLSEKSAHERSENLEELVRARTADLVIQNRELLEARDLLVEREKMAALGQVVAGVAHEVNTPLGVCVTAASFLSDKLKSGSGEILDRAELQDITGIIEANISRAANLIKGFKRVAVDETADSIRDFDLVSYLRDDLIPSLSPLLRKKGHEVLIKGPELCQMHIYPGSLAQVITNLVLNASVHGYGKSRGETITIDISESENRVKISVSDQGVGIDKELQARIFEPFFTTTKEQGGSGLGMMIVYNLVHGRLGGKLTCNTSPGEGTEFIVEIPRELEG